MELRNKKNGTNINIDDMKNDYETKKLIQKENSQNNNKKELIIPDKNKAFLYLIIFILSIILFSIIYYIIYYPNKNINHDVKLDNKNITEIKEAKKIINIPLESQSKNDPLFSTKWIVITTINPPNENLEHLINITKSWKIVIIGDIKTNNESWAIFKNSNRIIYLSLEDQEKLNYNITKYIPYNSYCRKNIGYLFAIQHGAREIYETDDNIYMTDENFLSLNISDYTFYAENNNSEMVNPYSFYGKSTLWPRGYRLKDLDKNSDTKFYRLLSKRTQLNHLIFQGIINIDPDVDSIFWQSRALNEKSTNETFCVSGNLMYLPGNFVPINSKNTKYYYDIFPSLALPTTVSKRVCDIWRGYLMQRYAWIYNGSVLFSPANAEHKRNLSNNNISLDFIEERDLYFKLDFLLNNLNIDADLTLDNPKKFIIILIEILVYNGILKKNDLDIYRAFIDDLDSFGYIYNLNFDNKIEKNEKKLLNFYSELKFYYARENKILLQNNNEKNIKVFRHKDPKIKYDDILLIINYNFEFLSKLNDYLFKLYNEYFPHIIFIYPGEVENNKTYVSCPESFKGYYSYYCIKRVYELYPNKKGYLFLMDDDFLKVWELENFDFNIPWLYHFFIKTDLFHKKSYKNTKLILDMNLDWKRKYRKFLGSDIIAYAVSDIYYIPQQDISKFCSMATKFYEKRVFLEAAVPTIMGIMLKPRYQIIQFLGLWGDGREEPIQYLRNAYKQVTVHPIKFSNAEYKEEVLKYIFIMKAEEY